MTLFRFADEAVVGGGGRGLVQVVLKGVRGGRQGRGLHLGESTRGMSTRGIQKQVKLI